MHWAHASGHSFITHIFRGEGEKFFCTHFVVVVAAVIIIIIIVWMNDWGDSDGNLVAAAKVSHFFIDLICSQLNSTYIHRLLWITILFSIFFQYIIDGSDELRLKCCLQLYEERVRARTKNWGQFEYIIILLPTYWWQSASTKFLIWYRRLKRPS